MEAPNLGPGGGRARRRGRPPGRGRGRGGGSGTRRLNAVQARQREAQRREYRAEFMRNQRAQQPEIRERENEQRLERYYQDRQNPGLVEAVRERDRAYHEERRQDPVFREAEQERDRAYHEERRQDPAVLERDRQYRQERRQNPAHRDPERIRDREYQRLRAGMTAEQQYRAKLQQGPTNVCSCCGGLFFIDSLTLPLTDHDLEAEGLTAAFIEQSCPLRTEDNTVQLCCTCKKYVIDQKRLPKLCMATCPLPRIPPVLANLTKLEERMVALRLPFMQIRPLGADRQYGVKGNIINVPVSVDTSIRVLPRNFDQTHTIQVKLMRRVGRGRPYIFETVRPAAIFAAAQYLQNTELYQGENIGLNENWLAQHPEEVENFIVHNQDRVELAQQNQNAAAEGVANEGDANVEPMAVDQPPENVADQVAEPMDVDPEPANAAEEPDDEAPRADNYQDGQREEEIRLEPDWIDEEEDNEQPINPGGQETLIQNENDPDPNDDQAIEYAPGQHNRPVSLLLDEHAEYKAYPSTYAGVPLRVFRENGQVNNRVTFGALSKFEVRHHDRRAARVEHLLFKVVKLCAKNVANSINICLRQFQGRQNVTAAQMLNNETVHELIQRNNGYQVLRRIRHSPAFWEDRKKDVLAMLRQLGCPTFFLTLSAAETRWMDLIIILKKVLDKEDITRAEAEALTYEQKAELIRRDPVTCATYFEHRIRAMFSLLGKQGTPFGSHLLKDFYIRVEFQHRGSPHVHCLLWLSGAPKYDSENPQSFLQCINFIDQHISCSRTGARAHLVEYQTHKHTKCCEKQQGSRKICRFSFPIPPMRRTTILRAIPPSQRSDEMKRRLKRISDYLQTLWRQREPITITFEEMLTALNMTEAEYIEAVRCSIKGGSSKVFLRRQPNEIKINAYNPKILELHEANMDIQFVLDPYACAAYILNYINKANRGMSRLLREVVQETRNGNLSLRERLRIICNKFLNASEISAQEAVYYLLSLSVSRASRKVVYINTASRENRDRMVRSREQLEELDPESTDIFMNNYLDYYASRHRSLENKCLAEIVADYEVKFHRNRARQAEEDAEEPPMFPEDDEVDENATEFRMTGFAASHKQRTKSKVIRYRRFRKEQDAANYYREQLMLFYPWRNEEVDLVNINHQAHYRLHKATIVANRRKYAPDDNEHALEAVQEFMQQLIEENEDAEVEAESQPEERLPNEFQVFYPRNSQPEPDIFQQMGLEVARDRLVRFTAPGQLHGAEYAEKIALLNRKQRQLMFEILNRARYEEPYHVFISGGAGVGKSALIETLCFALNRFYSRQPGNNAETAKILLCAPTGRAAFNIKGSTMHSVFVLPLNQYNGPLPRLNDSNMNTLRTNFRDIKVIIVDEISMVSGKLFNDMNTRLNQIFNMGEDVAFGNISVIAVGDLKQLAPVGGTWIFTPLAARGRLDMAILAGTWLWERFKYFELTEIMRQREDRRFAEALNNLRNNELSADDLALFRTREVMRWTAQQQRTIPPGVLHLFRSNVRVSAYNDQVLAQMTTEGALSIARDACLGNVSDERKRQELQRVQEARYMDTYGLPYELPLRINARYMVTVNIHTEDGIVNGALGRLRRFDYLLPTPERPNPEQRVYLLWLEFDTGVGAIARQTYSNHIRSRAGEIEPTWTPIELCKKTIKLSRGVLEVIRQQFPIVPAEAVTIHKSQGGTFQHVAFHVPDRCKRAELYVACSRATSLEGLYIYDQPFPTPRVPANDLVDQEYTRLGLPANRLHMFLPYWLPVRREGKFRIIYHNVENLNLYFHSTINDPAFRDAHVLFLTETLARETDTFPWAQYGFQELARINADQRRFGRGSLVVVESSIVDQCQLIGDPVLFTRGNYCLEIIALRIGQTAVISVYRSENIHIDHLIEQLRVPVYLTRDLREGRLMVMGDMNVNLNNQNATSNRLLEFLRHELGLRNMLLEEGELPPTTIQGTHIDLAFAKAADEDDDENAFRVALYESATSYHRPIMAFI